MPWFCRYRKPEVWKAWEIWSAAVFLAVASPCRKAPKSISWQRLTGQ
jgi:hypothetical protein